MSSWEFLQLSLILPKIQNPQYLSAEMEPLLLFSQSKLSNKLSHYWQTTEQFIKATSILTPVARLVTDILNVMPFHFLFSSTNQIKKKKNPDIAYKSVNSEALNIKRVTTGDILMTEMKVNTFLWFWGLFSWVGRKEPHLKVMQKVSGNGTFWNVIQTFPKRRTRILSFPLIACNQIMK